MTELQIFYVTKRNLKIFLKERMNYDRIPRSIRKCLPRRKDIYRRPEMMKI
jgi:hypothetical protein